MSIKEGDMVSIRQDFINRYKNVQESIIKAMDKALERAIGNKVINFEKCEGNYLDVYPLIGAVLQKEVRRVLGENANKDIYLLEYWGEDTGILIGTTMVYERHLWNEEVKVI